MNTSTCADTLPVSDTHSERALLQVRGLTVTFQTDQGVARAVDHISFSVQHGITLALVGESGCGKSVTALSLLRLIPTPPGQIESGRILFENRDLLALSEKDMRSIRGNSISMIFQEPMTSLNPVFQVGDQIGAILRLHRGLSQKQARKEAAELLQQVGISEANRRLADYPHQLSGGMLQRVMIAMALACTPKLLIADEPTTALDVTVQAQILELLSQLQQHRGLSILLITHDLAVVAEVAHQVAVMYAGRIVETASVEALFEEPLHPYTQGLFASLPGINQPGTRLAAIQGTVPAATNFPSGCRFHPRCSFAMPLCRSCEPELICGRASHPLACWLHQDPPMAPREQPS